MSLGRLLQRALLLNLLLCFVDYYPTGRALDLEINLVGAPNFRGVRGEPGSLGVYGVRLHNLPEDEKSLKLKPV